MAASSYDTGVGPDQPRSQPARLTRTATSPTTVPICLSARPLTSPESLRNRVILGAEVRSARTVDQCFTDNALNVALRALFAVTHIIAPHRLGPYIRDDNRADSLRAFCQLHNDDVQYNT